MLMNASAMVSTPSSSSIGYESASERLYTYGMGINGMILNGKS